MKLVVEEILWVIPMDDHYLTISTGTDVDEGPAAWEAIRAAAASLDRTE